MHFIWKAAWIVFGMNLLTKMKGVEGKKWSEETLDWSADPEFDGFEPTSAAQGLLSDSTVASVSLCAHKCLRTSNCSTFFYNRDTGRCKQFTLAFIDYMFMQPSEGWRYYRLDDEGCPTEKCFYRLRPHGLCLGIFRRENVLPYHDDHVACNKSSWFCYTKGPNSSLPMLKTCQQTKMGYQFLQVNTNGSLDYCINYLGTYYSASLSRFIWDDGSKMDGNCWVNPPSEPPIGKQWFCPRLRPDGWDNYGCYEMGYRGHQCSTLCQWH